LHRANPCNTKADRALKGKRNRPLAACVTHEKLTETITHLAFYVGWRSAMAAVAVVSEFFEKMRE
jgi:alkylhydroperoxidase/carboxymuconolactone decarboxylase family protein YurZ